MVRFNLFDFGMEPIQAESKLFNLVTRNKFWVYGTKNEVNPVVKIRCIAGKSTVTLQSIVGLFAKNGIEVVTEEVQPSKADYTIGLRKDLRSHPVLAAGILQTIVYAMEGRMKVPESYEIPKVPRLKPLGSKEVVKDESDKPTKPGRFEGFYWQRDSTCRIWKWIGGNWELYVPGSESPEASVEPEFA